MSVFPTRESLFDAATAAAVLLPRSPTFGADRQVVRQPRRAGQTYLAQRILRALDHRPHGSWTWRCNSGSLGTMAVDHGPAIHGPAIIDPTPKVDSPRTTRSMRCTLA